MDALYRQQRAPHILGHQIGEIDRAPAGRQPQRNLGLAETQPERAHKAQIEDRLVQLGVEHPGQLLQKDRAVVARRELDRHRVAHGLRTSTGLTLCQDYAILAKIGNAVFITDRSLAHKQPVRHAL